MLKMGKKKSQKSSKKSQNLIYRIGGAAVTGDGDIMLRFLPSFLALEFLRNGFTAQEAADKVIDRIFKFFPANSAAVVVTDMDGNYGAACQTFSSFSVSIFYPEINEVKVETVKCRQINDAQTTTAGSGFLRTSKEIYIFASLVLVLIQVFGVD